MRARAVRTGAALLVYVTEVFGFGNTAEVFIQVRLGVSEEIITRQRSITFANDAASLLPNKP